MKNFSILGLASASLLMLSLGTSTPAKADVFFGFGLGGGPYYHHHHFWGTPAWDDPEWGYYGGGCRVVSRHVKVWNHWSHHWQWRWQRQRVCY